MINALRPDLIIGNKEENYQEGIERLKKDFPVWMSDINTVADALDMIQSIATITGRQEVGAGIVSQIEKEMSILERRRRAKVLYLIWHKPWMAAGENTFIHDMISKMGLENVVGGDRYPEITLEEMAALRPDIVMLSSEPFPFRQSHANEIRKYLPSSKILFVDGEMFSWYGSRLLLAPAYLNQLPI